MADSAPRGAWRGGARGRGGQPTATRSTEPGRGRGARGGARGAATRGRTFGHTDRIKEVREDDVDELSGDDGGGPPAFEAQGEDAESRRRRFESSGQIDNRFMELKPLREAERVWAIQKGFLPDPLKPRRLDEATDFVGTCEEFCPEFEREEREYQNNVDLLERYPGTNRIDPARAVKAFHRPAAGNDQPLPSDVRPPHVLEQTLDYLFHEVLPSHPLHVTHPFLRDRTRAVRQDFTMQNVRGTSAIECNERIARYHVLALGTLREKSGFSESQELEQLRKVLKSLNEFYDDARTADPPIPTPREPEFRAYNILTHLRDPDIIWSTELLPADVFADPLFQTALSLHALAQRSNLQRGERASLNGFSRFFKLLSRPDIPYLFGCILSTHFGDIRKNALETLKKSYVGQHSSFPLRTLAKVLGCDDEEEVGTICAALGLETSATDAGKLVVKLDKGVTLKMNAVIKAKVSQRLVEAKRGTTSFPEIIDGTDYATEEVALIPQTPSLASPSFFRGAMQSTLSSSAPPPPLTFPPPQVARQGANPFAVGSSHASPPSSIPSGSIFGPGATSAFPPPPTISMPVPRPVPSSFAPSPFAPSPFAPSPFAPSPFTSTSASHFGQPNPAQPPLQPPKLDARAPAFVPPTAARPVPPAPAVLRPASTPSSKPTPQPSISVKLHPSSTPSLSTKPPRPPPTAPTPRPPPLSPSAKHALVTALTTALLRSHVTPAVRNAAELGLQYRWAMILQRRKQLVEGVTLALVDEVVRGFAAREAREKAWEVVRERELVERAWRRWVDRVEGRRREEERRRVFREVAKEIGVGPVREEMGEEGEGMEGILEGLEGMEGLSITGGMGDRRDELSDYEMVERLREAQRTRRQLWTPGTFLSTISRLVDDAAFLHRRPAKPAVWRVLVSTESKTDAFSVWLACKFGLEPPEFAAGVRIRDGEVEAMRVVGNEVVDDELFETTGLVVLDCTRSKSSPADSWEACRNRLQYLVRGTHEHSIYELALLVIVCPDDSFSLEAETALRTKVSKELNLSSLPNLKGSAILVAKLDHAEGQLATHLVPLLSEIALRPSKALLPLTAILQPLLQLWTASLERSLSRAATASAGAPAKVLCVFITSLAALVSHAKALAVLASVPPFYLPPPPIVGLVRPMVQSYVRHSAFAAAAHFPLVEGALVERPLVSDILLTRILLEHLADFVRTTYCGSTRQETLSTKLAPTLSRFEKAMEASERAVFAGEEKPRGESGRGLPPPVATNGRKKRKASLGPMVVTGSAPKKASLGLEEGDEGRKLDKLGVLMRDAQALLSSR